MFHKWHISISFPVVHIPQITTTHTILSPLGVVNVKSKAFGLFDSTASTSQDQGESPHVDSLPFYVTHYHLNATRVPQWNKRHGWLSKTDHEIQPQPKTELSADEWAPTTPRREDGINHLPAVNELHVYKHLRRWNKLWRWRRGFRIKEKTSCIPQLPSSQHLWSLSVLSALIALVKLLPHSFLMYSKKIMEHTERPLRIRTHLSGRCLIRPVKLQT